MSFDLTLYPQKGTELTRKGFNAYFRERDNFSLNGD
jgi:hypothetical protein